MKKNANTICDLFDFLQSEAPIQARPNLQFTAYNLATVALRMAEGRRDYMREAFGKNSPEAREADKIRLALWREKIAAFDRTMMTPTNCEVFLAWKLKQLAHVDDADSRWRAQVERDRIACAEKARRDRLSRRPVGRPRKHAFRPSA
jgi:hypothetical protein